MHLFVHLIIQEVHRGFPDAKFTPTHAVVATWENVAAYEEQTRTAGPSNKVRFWFPSETQSRIPGASLGISLGFLGGGPLPLLICSQRSSLKVIKEPPRHAHSLSPPPVHAQVDAAFTLCWTLLPSFHLRDYSKLATRRRTCQKFTESGQSWRLISVY